MKHVKDYAKHCLDYIKEKIFSRHGSIPENIVPDNLIGDDLLKLEDEIKLSSDNISVHDDLNFGNIIITSLPYNLIGDDLLKLEDEIKLLPDEFLYIRSDVNPDSNNIIQ